MGWTAQKLLKDHTLGADRARITAMLRPSQEVDCPSCRTSSRLERLQRAACGQPVRSAADLTSRHDKAHCTALHLAAALGLTATYAALLGAGASADARNRAGKTAPELLSAAAAAAVVAAAAAAGTASAPGVVVPATAPPVSGGVAAGAGALASVAAPSSPPAAVAAVVAAAAAAGAARPQQHPAAAAALRTRPAEITTGQVGDLLAALSDSTANRDKALSIVQALLHAVTHPPHRSSMQEGGAVFDLAQVVQHHCADAAVLGHAGTLIARLGTYTEPPAPAY